MILASNKDGGQQQNKSAISRLEVIEWGERVQK